ncbi:hypothetical protein HDU79_001725 [Rhizoclosmatium sp. JEL0117]|nr:hypothetical protein HDU79_001725 [Rhizoclosmatium sp. JEL0117]
MSGGMGGGMGIRNAGMSRGPGMDRGGGGGGGGDRMDYEQRGRDQQQRDPRDHYNDDVRASSVQSRRGGYTVPNSRSNEGRGDARGGSTYSNSGDARGDGGYDARNSCYGGNFEARGNFPSQQPQGVDANSGYSASSSKNQALPQGTYGNADWDSAYDTPSYQTTHVSQQATASFDQTRKYDMNELKAIGQKQVPAPFKDVPYLYVGPEPVVVPEPPAPIRSKNPTSTGQDSRNTPVQPSKSEMPDIPSLLAKRTVDLDAPKVPFQPKHVFLSGDGVYNPKAGRAAGGMQNQQGQGGMQQQRQPQGFVGYGGGGNSGGIVHNQQQGGMPQQTQQGEIGSGENRGNYGGGDRDGGGFGSGGGAKGVPAHRGGLYQGGGDDAGIYKGGSAPVFASSGSDDVDEWA